MSNSSLLSSSGTAIPLTGIRTTAQILGFACEVSIQECYKNQETSPIEAVYRYSLPHGAAVKAFQCVIAGRLLIAKVQPREQGQALYDDTIAAGGGAYMLEQTSGRQFCTSIGNVPPGAKVTITITYVVELHVRSGGIHLELPCYESLPSSVTTTVHLNMQSAIKEVTSTSHKILFVPGSPSLHHGRVDVGVGHGGSFHLAIRLADPHVPSVCIQQDPVSGRKVACLSLFPLQQVVEHRPVRTEMIFVVDRSGSMSGSKMSAVRDTLRLFLRSIPPGTLFNIVSFGTSFSSLFPSSVKYDQGSLATADQHVTDMDANMGGTNMMKPLQFVFSQAHILGAPRQIFILTDGQVDDRKACTRLVKQHAASCRVFSLGIGSDVDRLLVNKLAMAGHGAADFVQEQVASDVQVKVLQQINRALEPVLIDNSLHLADGMVEHQAPSFIPPVWHGDRIVVYLTLKEGVMPFTATLHSTSAATQERVQCSVVVSPDQVSPGDHICKLAAYAAIHELQNSKDQTKELTDKIVDMSVQHQILSRHTCFVATDSRGTATAGTMVVRHVNQDNSLNSIKSIMAANIDSVLQRGECLERLVEASEDLSISARQFRGNTSLLQRGSVLGRVASGVAGFFSSAFASVASLGAPAQTGQEQPKDTPATLPSSSSASSSPSSTIFTSVSSSSSSPASSSSNVPRLMQLINCQQADGRFPVTSLGSLQPEVRASHLLALLPPGVPRSDLLLELYVTALVVNILQKDFTHDEILWKLVAAKARTFIFQEREKMAGLRGIDIEKIINTWYEEHTKLAP
eukprot:TRINITY_DN517_c0_g1_i6.p1 TRINITY_DN517_c0_g1~~TRINITY_DN517_c0_g1_i6.p1  ORF type:complete len:798 (-),score=137.04 TRINITY_DN517_c0_g1_i6:236-2629(-)